MNHLRPAVASLILCVLLSGLPGLAAMPVRAQSTEAGQPAQVMLASDWTPGSAIPQYAPSTLPPVMVADQNRTVHALASMPLTDDPSDPASEEIGIFYRQWTLAGGWNKPIDIMLTPVKQQARVKSALLDSAGILHMIFYGGDEQIAYIYYSAAPAAAAGSAQAWSAPLPVGPNAVAPDVAAIAGDGGDRLAVLYSGNLGEGNSLYAVYSEDAGLNWSEPVMVFSTYSATNKVFDMSVSYSQSGVLHATWNVTDNKGQNVAGYYAQLVGLAGAPVATTSSSDGTSGATTLWQWSTPQEIAASQGLGVAIPSVIEHQGEVLLLYNNGLAGQVAPVMWLIRSRDGGQTFSSPQRAFPNHVGRNGTVALVVDGSGALHAFFGQRIAGGFDGAIDLHGMWHSVWGNGNWGPVRPVVSGPPSPAFDPYDATAVVSQGNVILLTWRTDPGREIRSTWYAHQVLDVPESPLVALPVPATAGEEGLQAELQAESRSQAQDQLQAGQEMLAFESAGGASTAPAANPAPPLPEFSKLPAPASAGNPAAPLLGALAPTILFVAAALAAGSLLRRRRTNLE